MIITVDMKTKEIKKEMRELLKEEIKILKDGQKLPDLSEYYSYEALKKAFYFYSEKGIKNKDILTAVLFTDEYSKKRLSLEYISKNFNENIIEYLLYFSGEKKNLLDTILIDGLRDSLSQKVNIVNNHLLFNEKFKEQIEVAKNLLGDKMCLITDVPKFKYSVVLAELLFQLSFPNILIFEALFLDSYKYQETPLVRKKLQEELGIETERKIFEDITPIIDSSNDEKWLNKKARELERYTDRFSLAPNTRILLLFDKILKVTQIDKEVLSRGNDFWKEYSGTGKENVAKYYLAMYEYLSRYISSYQDIYSKYLGKYEDAITKVFGRCLC